MDNEGKGSGTEPRDLPEELANADPQRIEALDVREKLRRGDEPFEEIMAAAGAVPENGVLRVRAIFEPRPLYGVMAGRGFEHWTEKLAADDWRVWFWRPGAQRDAGSSSTGPGTTASNLTESKPEGVENVSAAKGPYLLDVRELDGPDKHPTIHRMFDALEPGGTLTIVNDHQPKPLFYELKAERPDRFDAENYRAYEADDRVWVAVLPTTGDGSTGS